MSRIILRLICGAWLFASHGLYLYGVSPSEPLRKAESLEQQLKRIPIELLAAEVKKRGEPRQGAVLFYRSSAACGLCHLANGGQPPLGPELKSLVGANGGENFSDEYLLRAMLYPSKDIREAYRASKFLTVDGEVHSGIVTSRTPKSVELRSPSDLARPIQLSLESIEEETVATQSLMPEGLISSFREASDFYHLASYVIAVAQGGISVEDKLRPTAEDLAVREDWLNLDHAGIIKGLKGRDFESGKAIYHGYCVDCHGPDGNRPNLPTARAFGTQPLKFGADPYSMFMTLSKGNGLMGAMSHLSPHQRYEVVHYIREAFMKPTNPAFTKIDSAFLKGLPTGTEDGTFVPDVKREFGPAFVSQLEQKYESVITHQATSATFCYDLHTMDSAGVWRDGFLKLDQTQHALSRGEGNPSPQGKFIQGLQGWAWGHDGTLDYPRDALLPRGPMPAKWMRFIGYHLRGNELILRYAIDGREIFELPSASKLDGSIRHDLRIEAGEALLLCLCQPGDGWSSTPIFKTTRETDQPNDQMLLLETNRLSGEVKNITIKVAGDVKGMKLAWDPSHRAVLEIPEDNKARNIVIELQNSATKVAHSDGEVQLAPDPLNVADLTRNLRWPETLHTTGTLGLESGAYAVDTLSIPKSNPWNTWFRTAAIDFLSDGRMVVSTYGGDVWIVSNVDDELLDLRWKRFAAGLYEPFGLRVVDDQIYVTCKDRIVRLHDMNRDGEADFYENFSDDTDVSTNFHAFNFDLQTDDEGNFYYAKGGHGADFELPGAIIKISPDGKHREIVCTGFRVPNGMGTLPGGGLVCSDNQGQWMPSSKINWIEKDKFYGWVPTYNGKGRWSADGGKIDIAEIIPPKSFEEPMLWLPHRVDNSSGGQIWVDDDRWGPLSKKLLHTSFGKGWLFYVMVQKLDSGAQAAAVRFPFDFRTGIMRGRVNPRDGQVYVTGLQGWNGGGRPGLLDQGIQRVRYTGRTSPFVTDAKATKEGLRLTFNLAIDPRSLDLPDAVTASYWNYLWQESYGSDEYSPKTGKVGAEALQIDGLELSDDHKSLLIQSKDLQPVDQLRLVVKLKIATGEPFEEEVWWTIHQLP